jgi:hypothetical protein
MTISMILMFPTMWISMKVIDAPSLHPRDSEPVRTHMLTRAWTEKGDENAIFHTQYARHRQRASYFCDSETLPLWRYGD